METLLDIARRRADRVEIFYQTTAADRVRFEDGRLKDVESSMLSGVGLTIIRDGRLGTAYTRNLRDRQELVDLALAALAGGVEAVYELAPVADLPELDTWDANIEKLDTAALVDEGTRIVDAIRPRVDGQVNVGLDRKVRTVRVVNSAGFDRSVRGSSYGGHFSVFFPGSYASIGRGVTGKGFQPAADDDLDYVVTTFNASQKQVRAQPGPTHVLFLPESLYTLVWRLTAATTGRTLYEQVSPVQNKTGEQVLSPLLTLTDAPLDDTQPGARSFDDEGTACRDHRVFDAGVLQGFYTDRYYARKLRTEPTGNGWRRDVTTRPAPGLAHLRIEPGPHSLAGLLAEMRQGLIVAGALGAHSGNILNGDYSIGLSPGLWVEGGEIVGHVKDAMIAGNVYEDLKRAVAVGDRLESAYMGRFPALLLEGVRVATR